MITMRAAGPSPLPPGPWPLMPEGLPLQAETSLPPAKNLPLQSGELHVWSANLDSWGLPESEGVLSREELQRGRAIAGAQRSRRWMAGRAFLRGALSRYLDVSPDSLRFSYGQRDKPELRSSQSEQLVRGGSEVAPLRFNLSHSGALAVCALTRACAVGCDVQLLPPRLDPLRVALRAFGDEEVRRLRALPAPQRRIELLRAWVALEAERKRIGLGIAHPSEPSIGPTPWMGALDVGPGGAGAVSLGLPPCAMRYGRWSAGPA